MTDVWSERAEAYRESDAHREGRDLELFAEWAEGETGLDVATGGGHVARVLRDAGLEVVTIDPAPGMNPTVISRAEEIPFADSSFDVVACRVAVHHFQDPAGALQEMARVSRGLVLVADNLYLGEDGEEADRLHDPTHVRNYSEDEWRGMLDAAGLELEAFEREDKRIDFRGWLDRADTPEEDRARIEELLGDRIEDGKLRLDRGIFKGRVR
jgi:SAM-dependent methyltransferase